MHENLAPPAVCPSHLAGTPLRDLLDAWHRHIRRLVEARTPSATRSRPISSAITPSLPDRLSPTSSPQRGG